MKKEYKPPIIGRAYPIAAGEHYGYRCFDGKMWHDCDKNGRKRNGQ